MNETLQDLAWAVLPKEFKEEVKSQFRRLACIWSSHNESKRMLLINIFGIDNLTSDAEGEVELLRVTRQKVMGLYANAKKIHDLYTSATCINTKESQQIDICKGVMSVLDTLFGSKCLPDETCNVASVDVASNVASSKPKPDEPKYPKGSMVHSTFFGYEGDYRVVGYNDGTPRYYDCIDRKGLNFRFPESYLEPYTEPEASTCTETCTDDCSSQCKSQDFDNILKDGFTKERRLNIASMAMQGILANPKLTEWQDIDREEAHPEIISAAFCYADALIADAEKGGES